MNLRINDVLNEHQRVLLPIDGYQNVPLMSLEDAVKPIIHLFPVESLLTYVWTVKERCKEPADGLSQDDSASIMLYTVDWPVTEQSLYFILNQTLRLENRDNLKPWFPYLRLFIGALLQLSPINDMIFRGVKRDLSGSYPEESNSVWWGLSSCTDAINVLESDQFCGKTGARTMFHIKCSSGRNIKNHSYYQSESEILLLPGRYLRTRGRYSGNDGLHIIVLDEIKPPHEFLKLPDIKPWRFISSGLSLLGICKNSNCEAHQKEVIMHIDSEKFDVLLDTNVSNAKCPICDHYVEPLKLGFCQCRWRIYGIKQTQRKEAPINFSEEWSYAHGNSLLEYDLQNGAHWRKLIVEVKVENSS